MPADRPDIPADLRRQVLVEAGHRCAIPTCRQHPVDIDHIEDWATNQEHRFENLIALCPTCHRRKGSGPGQIDRRSLRQYKANLGVLTQRYNDVERRILVYLAQNPGKSFVSLPGGLDVAVQYLITDGYLLDLNIKSASITLSADGSPVNHADGSPADFPIMKIFQVTDAGRDFVQRWVTAQNLDD